MHWDELIVFVLVGVVCLAALGVAFAHVIPNFESTAAYVNAVFLPVVFVSFYVFDSSSAPRFLRTIAEALPLKPLIDGLSGAMVTGSGLSEPPRRARRDRAVGRVRAVSRRARLLVGGLARMSAAGSSADRMKQLAEGVHLLRGWPPNAINVYLIGDVLIDAATRQGEQRIMRQIAGRKLSAHALTHAHPDHQGSSHAICERLQIPLWCGQGDVPAMETPGGISNSQAPGWLNRLQQRFWTGPPHPVARALIEGDEVAGFTVLETPGHSRGHLAYWRESDRVLILGDVLNNINVMTGIPGLHEPPESSPRTPPATATPRAGSPRCGRG